MEKQKFSGNYLKEISCNEKNLNHIYDLTMTSEDYLTWNTLKEDEIEMLLEWSTLE